MTDPRQGHLQRNQEYCASTVAGKAPTNVTSEMEESALPSWVFQLGASSAYVMLQCSFGLYHKHSEVVCKLDLKGDADFTCVLGVRSRLFFCHSSPISCPCLSVCCGISQYLGFSNRTPKGSTHRFGIDILGLLRCAYVKVVFNCIFTL